MELSVLGGLVWAWLADSRLERERRPACRDAAVAIHERRVVPAIIALHRAVQSERREAMLTPDGVIPAESFDDALAREQYVSEFRSIEDAVQQRLEPHRMLAGCIRRASRLRDALAAFAIAVPVALWPPITKTNVVDWLQASLGGLIGICAFAVAVAVAFTLYASAAVSFERCIAATEELE